MRPVVDLDLCQGHGVCADEAPEVFRAPADVDLLPSHSAGMVAGSRRCGNGTGAMVFGQRLRAASTARRARSSWATASPRSSDIAKALFQAAT